MIHYEKLGRIKNAFFFLGFFISQLKHVPFTLLLVLSNTTALTFYLSGYLIWLFSSHFYPEHPHRFKNWYSFAQFKNQHKAAAALGIIAVACSFLAIFVPFITIPSYWLLAISSCIWSISEYHKLKNPLAREENYSHSRQQALFRYSGLIASMSIVFALTATIPLFFPQATALAFFTSLLLGGGLGISAFRYWLSCNFGDHKPDKKVSQHSYEKCTQRLVNGGTPAHEKNVQQTSSQRTTKSPSIRKIHPLRECHILLKNNLNNQQASVVQQKFLTADDETIRCN